MAGKGQVDAYTVTFEGLAALDRALGRADKNLRSGIRAELREVADVVASEARSIQTRLGLHDTGDLTRRTTAFALTGRAGVRSSAVHGQDRPSGPYNYPRRLEFEGGSGGEPGPRASLLPAVDAKASELDEAAEALLDRFASDFGRS